MSKLELREPEVPNSDSWFGKVDEPAAVLICAAEMQWSKFNLWKMLVTVNWERGIDAGEYEMHTGIDEFSGVVDKDGVVDLVAALQIADYYCLMMLSQRGYNTTMLELEVECSGGTLKSETSNVDGTFSALAAGYYSAFAADDVLGRSQLFALASAEEISGALAVLFMLAHTDMEEDEE
jgi:hypothetical protein